jgi:UDP-N-acetylglucosamine diphosphorylase/glucosamine-1-phosphate N-acetyltransferase
MTTQLVMADGPWIDCLKPFTITRTGADLRVGILTLREKWEHRFKQVSTSTSSEPVSRVFPFEPAVGVTSFLFVRSNLLASATLLQAFQNLGMDESLWFGNQWLGCKVKRSPTSPLWDLPIKRSEFHGQVGFVEKVWHIFQLNGQELASDFELLTEGRYSQPIPQGNQVIHPERVFLEEGATVQLSILNASSGPIYIGRNAEVMEGSIIRGRFALCEGSATKLGSKIYGPTTIGPHSKVGGEINNSVVFGYSNKAHDGFLGNSVIGEWCNLGADTNNSNLKNNYSTVEIYDYVENGMVSTGLQFCGLFMGDHSKCGINTMFNTGTVVGVMSNIFGAGFPPKYIPSFSWGGAEGFQPFLVSKAFELAERVMSRREVPFTDAQKGLLQTIFDQEHGRG